MNVYCLSRSTAFYDMRVSSCAEKAVFAIGRNCSGHLVTTGTTFDRQLSDVEIALHEYITHAPSRDLMLGTFARKDRAKVGSSFVQKYAKLSCCQMPFLRITIAVPFSVIILVKFQ